MKYRCSWAKNDLSIQYHDAEWGVPLHDDQALFELLTLEGAQAGLSWDTVLAKRGNYRKAFDNFDIKTVASYGTAKHAELLQNPGIIRNRLKIASATKNAQAFLKVQEEFGSFNAYLWEFVENTPIVNNWSTMDEVPAKTALAETISKDLKKRGFTFVGPTIIYAYMQSAGLVNDHIASCFRRNPSPVV
ncbi:DNA-3-methyladenine glycosylase I [Candidatus Saccharibacteria bacterium TM7i]|nr:DNA-3-methyladenine glycosylase I [Candidatus Saccharibacteria bacterium TM7i]